MNRFRKIIKNIVDTTDSLFIIKIKKACDIITDITEGGLILPSGEIVRIYGSDGISYYDLITKLYTASDKEAFDVFDNFDEEIQNNGIIKYSINHDFQPNFITLPTLNITNEQKEIVQMILELLPDEQTISIMLEDDLFKELRANNTAKIDNILIKFIEEDADELEEGEKKIFDKKSGYNISKDEQFIFDKLKKKYPKLQMSITDDRFVNPDTHRHFQIDFYDPESDTAFNFNKHIKHGRRKYNSQDPNCIGDVEWLESAAKPGNFYEKILHTWKDLDPLKRVIAKQNGLKLIEWFNLDEFLRWYKNPELTYEEYKYAPDSMQYDSEDYFEQKARGRDIYGLDSDPYAP